MEPAGMGTGECGETAQLRKTDIETTRQRMWKKTDVETARQHM